MVTLAKPAIFSNPWKRVRAKNAELTRQELGAFIPLHSAFNQFMSTYSNHIYIKKKLQDEPEKMQKFLELASAQGNQYITGMFTAKTLEEYEGYKKSFNKLIDHLYTSDVTTEQLPTQNLVNNALHQMSDALKHESPEQLSRDDRAYLYGLISKIEADDFDAANLYTNLERSDLKGMTLLFTLWLQGKPIDKDKLKNDIDHNRLNLTGIHQQLDTTHMRIQGLMFAADNVRESQLEKIMDYWSLTKDTVYTSVGLAIVSVGLVLTVVAPFLVIPGIIVAVAAASYSTYDLLKTTKETVSELWPKRGKVLDSEIVGAREAVQEKIKELTKTLSNEQLSDDEKERLQSELADLKEQDESLEAFKQALMDRKAPKFRLIDSKATKTIGKGLVLGTVFGVSVISLGVAVACLVGVIPGVAFPPAIAIAVASAAVALAVGVIAMAAGTFAFQYNKARRIKSQIKRQAGQGHEAMNQCEVKPLAQMQQQAQRSYSLLERLSGLSADETLPADEIVKMKTDVSFAEDAPKPAPSSSADKVATENEDLRNDLGGEIDMTTVGADSSENKIEEDDEGEGEGEGTPHEEDEGKKGDEAEELDQDDDEGDDEGPGRPSLS